MVRMTTVIEMAVAMSTVRAVLVAMIMVIAMTVHSNNYGII